MKNIKYVFLSFLFFAQSVAYSQSLDQPDWLKSLNLQVKFTADSFDHDILEFNAENLGFSEKKCKAEMPTVDRAVIGGGMEPACVQYEPGRYSCICVLKLHKKNQQLFQEYIFYLKKPTPTQ